MLRSKFSGVKRLAGVVGFEPTIHATKKHCLTTWLHPNSDVLITQDFCRPQDPKSQKLVFKEEKKFSGKLRLRLETHEILLRMRNP